MFRQLRCSDNGAVQTTVLFRQLCCDENTAECDENTADEKHSFPPSCTTLVLPPPPMTFPVLNRIMLLASRQ